MSLLSTLSTVSSATTTWRRATASKRPTQRILEEWVQIDGGLAAWGNRHADGSGFTSRFELKLQTGTFTITSTANGQIAHGWCHGRALTS
jgi:hypothetical protein